MDRSSHRQILVGKIIIGDVVQGVAGPFIVVGEHLPYGRGGTQLGTSG